MKSNIILAFTALLFLCVVGCESHEDDLIESTSSQSQLLPSMKGYELYSWKTSGHWSYTLITGTNRNKGYDEIVSPDNIENKEWVKISVQDLASLKTLLRRVPANESISWINTPDRVAGFSLPESTTVMEIKRHCSALNVNLQIIK